MKTCSHCHEMKPLDQWSPSQQRKNSSWCRACMNKSAQRWQRNNREKVKALKKKFEQSPKGKAMKHRAYMKARERRAEQGKLYYLANRDEIRFQQMSRKFGITPEEYLRLFEAQGGVCGACGEAPTIKRLAVDHDHETDEIRGLLCANCNLGLGAFRDDPKVLRGAAEYLEAGFAQRIMAGS